MKLWGLLFTLLVVLNVVALSFADDGGSEHGGNHGGENHGGENHDREREFDREVQAEYEGDNRVQFKSESKDADSEARVRFRLSTENGRLRLELSVESRTNVTHSSRLRLQFDRLVEFVESGATAGFQSGEDTVVDALNFRGRDRRRSQGSSDTTAESGTGSEDTNPDGTAEGSGSEGTTEDSNSTGDDSGHNSGGHDGGEEGGAPVQWDRIVCTPGSVNVTFSCNAHTTDGQFGIILYIVSSVTSVEGYPVRPTSVKIDVIVNKTTRTAGTKLALQTKFQARESTDLKSQSDENEEGFVRNRERQVSFGSVGFFSWSETAVVNGVNVNVINSQLVNATAESGEENEGDCNRITFTFDTTEVGEIVWDPKFSWSASSDYTATGTDSGSIWFGPSFLLIAFLAFFLKF